MRTPITLDEVRRLAFELAGNSNQVEAWLDTPLSEYDGMTPRELVELGRGDVLIVHVGQITSGSSG